VVTPPEGWVESGQLEGRPAIRQFFAGLKEAWEGEDSAVLRELFTVGELVVTRMDWQVRGRVSGIDASLALTNVNAIDAGEIVRQQHYLDHAEALEAARVRSDRQPPR
jgi:hypothetical protein